MLKNLSTCQHIIHRSSEHHRQNDQKSKIIPDDFATDDPNLKRSDRRDKFSMVITATGWNESVRHYESRYVPSKKISYVKVTSISFERRNKK